MSSFIPGDIFIVYLKKQELALTVVSSPGNNAATVSGTSLTEFALAPPTEEGDETVIKRWERHDPLRPHKTAQLVNRPQNAVTFTKESQPMGLGDAMGHFDPFLTKAFRVSEGVYGSTGCKGVAEGEEYFAAAT